VNVNFNSFAADYADFADGTYWRQGAARQNWLRFFLTCRATYAAQGAPRLGCQVKKRLGDEAGGVRTPLSVKSA
jgi:hypothetical protein